MIGATDRPLRIACVGEAMVEIKLDPSGKTASVGYAGDTLNTAIYLRRCLPPRHDVAFVSVIGQDDISDRMADFILSEGVSTAHLARHPTRTVGLYMIRTDADGERSFTYWRDTSAARTLFAAGAGCDFAGLGGFDGIYLSAITLAILPDPTRDAFFTWLSGFRQRGGLVVFDSNYRPRQWPTPDAARAAIERAWRLCDIGLPSADDEMALFGDARPQDVRTRLRAWGVHRGALKCGPAGPLALGDHVAVPEFPAVAMVDSTAAGDSFNGAYLASILAGSGEAQALQAGHACAARVVGHPGAIIPQDVWKQVR